MSVSAVSTLQAYFLSLTGGLCFPKKLPQYFSMLRGNTMKPCRSIICLLLVLIIALAPLGVGVQDIEAKKGGSFGKSSSWSSSTKGTWDRSGGGIFGSGSKTSGGYSKPVTSPPSSSYSKPSLSTSPQGSDFKAPASGTPSAGYSKPALQSQPPQSSGGYSKPVGAAGAVGAVGAVGAAGALGSTGSQESFSGGSKFDKQTVGELRKKSSQESLQRYQEEKTKFKNPEFALDKSKYESSPLYQKGKVYSGFDYGTHYSNRDNFYRSQGYQAPGFAFGGSPSFGMFDTLFLFWMLDHLGNKNVSATAYHHQNDPGYQKWRQEADQLAKDNAELKGKLAELDKQVKSMDGTPKDPGYLPAGVPPEIALAATALSSRTPEKPMLRIATGQSGGWYDKYANLFRTKSSGLDVKTIPTSGAFENLKLLADGKADLAIVQSDVLAMANSKLPDKKLVTEQSTLYPEYIQLITNTKSGIKSIADLNPSKNIIYVGPKGSGSALTWEGLGNQNDKYKKLSIQHTDFYSALEAVQKKPDALMLFVGGLNSDFLKKAEEIAKKNGSLALVALDDSHLDDRLDQNGNPIYSFVNIPKDVYPYLQKGWLFSHETKTLAVQAVLALRTDWAQEFGPNAMDALSLTVLETKPEFEKIVNAKK